MRVADKAQAAIYAEGLAGAAAYLEATAADYEQMAAARDKHAQDKGRMLPGVRLSYITGAQALREKAQLLRGQAGHIRNLKH